MHSRSCDVDTEGRVNREEVSLKYRTSQEIFCDVCETKGGTNAVEEGIRSLARIKRIHSVPACVREQSTVFLFVANTSFYTIKRHEVSTSYRGGRDILPR